MKLVFISIFSSIFLTSLYTTTNAQMERQKVFQMMKDSIAKNAPEKNVLNAINPILAKVNNKQFSDSAYTMLVKAYPDGIISAYRYLDNVLMYRVPISIDSFINIRKRFSSVNVDDMYGSTGKLYYQIRYWFFGDFIEEDSVKTMQKIYPELKTADDLNSVAWYLYDRYKQKHIGLAKQIAKEGVAKGERELVDSAKVPQNVLNEWKEERMRSYCYALDTYATIIEAEGQDPEGYNIRTRIVTLTGGEDPVINNPYISSIARNKGILAAIQFGENTYLKGYGDQTTTYLLDSLYKIQNPGENSAEYIKKLETARLHNSLLNVPAPDFSLHDLNGKVVSLKDLKGKIVILDLWATWCVPCKMSFPGMQIAINKYKNNKDVVFLFADTFERFPDSLSRHNAVAAVMKSMNLNFEVLMDMPIKKGDYSNYQLATNLNVSSIPTKFVIGKDGLIKFKMVGYAGSDESVVKEIDDALQMLM